MNKVITKKLSVLLLVYIIKSPEFRSFNSKSVFKGLFCISKDAAIFTTTAKSGLPLLLKPTGNLSNGC